MSIFQIGCVKSSKTFGLLLAVIASFAILAPAYAHDSLKTVLSRRVVGKTVILIVRDVETGKISTITGQAGRDSLVVLKDPAKASLPTKPIEQVRAGQWVPTRNPLTGKTEYKQVKRTFVHTVPTIVSLRLADAKTGKVVETLKGTPEHPFFTTDKGMVGMGHLRVGETVISRVGPVLRVASVVPESKPGGYKVYNFEVADDHTYFVGKANGGTWVHNTCTWLTPGSLPASEEADVVDAMSHVDAGTTPPWLHPNARGVFGRPYRNLPTRNGDALPGTPGAGGYTEYDVAPPAGVTTRGPLRILRNNTTGEMYYTNTHYGDSGWPSFWRIR